MEPSFNFILPDPRDFPSGGNIYNQHFLLALRQLRPQTKLLAWKDFAENDYLPTTTYIFDTLYLSELTHFSTRESNGASFLLVHHLKSLYPPEGLSSKTVYDLEEKTVLNWMDGFITTSEYTTNYLIQNGLTQEIITIPPPLTFRNTFSVAARPSTPINALLVANWVKRKGILPFLKIIALHAESFKQHYIKIHLVGGHHLEPTYAEQCQNVIEDANLDGLVIVHGAVPPSRMPHFYQQSNLFISTSAMETYGMALQEAKAFGLPILAIKGGNVENHVKNEENGFLVPKIHQLVEQLLQLSNNPEMVRMLLENCQRLLQNDSYSWEKAARKFLDFIEKMKE
ncbi:MAG: glycosyltransferase family 4 protein [Bacteroidota bacterium]